MARNKAFGGSITITTTISRELWDKAHNKIGWSEALRRGVVMILAEKGDEDYINPLQQSRKIAALVQKIEELVQENEKLRNTPADWKKDKYAGYVPEMDEITKGVKR